MKKVCETCGICRPCCLASRVAGGTSIVSIICGDSETGAWNCANCWKCIEACPEGVDVYEEMIRQRREEEAPEEYRKKYESICKTGYGLPVDELNDLREMWGLKKIKLIDREKLRKLLGDDDSGDE